VRGAIDLRVRKGKFSRKIAKTPRTTKAWNRRWTQSDDASKRAAPVAADKKESKSYPYRRLFAFIGGFNPSLLSRSLRSSRLGESIPFFMRTSIELEEQQAPGGPESISR
jgi:hypothetical protein